MAENRIVDFYGYVFSHKEYIDFIEKYYIANFFPSLSKKEKNKVMGIIKCSKKDPGDRMMHLFYMIWGEEEGSKVKACGDMIFQDLNCDYQDAKYYIGMYEGDLENYQDHRIGVCSSIKRVIGETEIPQSAKEAFDHYGFDGYGTSVSLKLQVS